jgi:transposase
MNRARPLPLTEDQRQQLDQWVRGRRTPQRLSVRAKLILLAASGISNLEIGKELGVAQPTVRRWRRRFLEKGLEGLVKDAPRPGRKPKLPEEKVKAIVEATLHTTPRNATHWTVRTMAKAQGVSPGAVFRIWRAHDLKPHRVETFKFSNDPRFVEKLQDVVGLYLNPPAHAIVFSVDEKSQIQALDRTQPLLPIRPGVPARQTHDYKRNGTTTLFAALNLLDGTIIHDCMRRHRHQEFLKFMRRLDRETPKKLDVHLIVDNYATHKHKKVKAWLAKRPRFHFHFIPTSSSWLNIVERWFASITNECIRRGTFISVESLVQAINAYIANSNRDPHIFVWTKSADEILAKIAKLKALYETGH